MLSLIVSSAASVKDRDEFRDFQSGGLCVERAGSPLASLPEICLGFLSLFSLSCLSKDHFPCCVEGFAYGLVGEEVGIRAPLPLFLRLRRREAGRKLDHPSASDCSFAKESKSKSGCARARAFYMICNLLSSQHLRLKGGEFRLLLS